MLDIGTQFGRSRRAFLQVGSLALGGLSFADLLRSPAAAAQRSHTADRQVGRVRLHARRTAADRDLRPEDDRPARHLQRDRRDRHDDSRA